MHWSPVRTSMVSLLWIGIVLGAAVGLRRIELCSLLPLGLSAIWCYGCQATAGVHERKE
jgi:hypothetical protein